NKINSESVKNIDRFIFDVTEDFAFIEGCVQKAYKDSVTDGKIDLTILKKYDVAVIKRVIIKYFLNYNTEVDRIHLDNILSLLEKQGKTQIKGNIFALSDGSFLRCADFSKQVNEPKYKIQILKISEFNLKNVDFYCDCDKISGNAVVRHRMAGDTIRPAGRNCTKPLKKLFNELKIPQEKRGSVGVVCDDDGVIGVIGYCVDERVRLDSSTKNVLSIKLPLED
ncbi:MAG: tRNA lysidine(34) synthetase TilS, partial [Eubacterium sp.]